MAEIKVHSDVTGTAWKIVVVEGQAETSRVIRHSDRLSHSVINQQLDLRDPSASAHQVGREVDCHAVAVLIRCVAESVRHVPAARDPCQRDAAA